MAVGGKNMAGRASVGLATALRWVHRHVRTPGPSHEVGRVRGLPGLTAQSTDSGWETGEPLTALGITPHPHPPATKAATGHPWPTLRADSTEGESDDRSEILSFRPGRPWQA